MRARAGCVVVLCALGVGGMACSDDASPTADAPSTERDATPPESGPDEPLVAEFSSEPDYDVTGGTSCPLRDITFSDESGGDPEEWLWEFSDGSTSTEQNPVVTTEVFEATLTVTRGDASDSVSHDVSIAVC